METESTPADLTTLTPAVFARFAHIAYESAGILLRPGKEALVLARVQRRIRALELRSVAEYANYLEGDRTGHELVQFLDSISTNVTSFFRESEHFDFLRVYADEAVRARKRRRLRFWSAACSSGEEPYTLAMVLDDTLGKSVDWRILATDVSTQVLTRATKGIYTERSIEPVPAAYRARYLRKEPGQAGEEVLWSVVPELRDRILFRRLNLAQPPYPMRGTLDVVLCRNVMIYFDDAVRMGIVKEAERLLVDDGVFITSHTETIASLETKLTPCSASIYRKGGRK